ncbi:MAG: YbjN domain-containing protein [Clostridia bacterium]|nr:YbjN domain-containing protein [Clostridia bacterium]
MNVYKEFCNLINEQRVKYNCGTTEEGASYINFNVAGKNFSALNIHIFFDEEKLATATIRAFQLCKFPEEKNLLLLQTVNNLNYKYRWVTFSATEEGQIVAGMDVDCEGENVAARLFRMLERFLSVVDAAYPNVMKVLYT